MTTSAPGGEPDVNPESVLRAGIGLGVQVSAHRALWSGAFPGNSLAAIDECFQLRVARAEIDVRMLQDSDYAVLHGERLEATTDGIGSALALSRSQIDSLHLLVSEDEPGVVNQVPLLSDVVSLVLNRPGPTVLEVDLQDVKPIPWPRVEELVGLLEPIRQRVILTGYDWNLRRVMQIDRFFHAAVDPWFYFDWTDEKGAEDDFRSLRVGAYGYLDAHPLARERWTARDDYVIDRMGSIFALVPGAREMHIGLEMFEQLVADAGDRVAALVHDREMLLAVWTLNADAPNCLARCKALVQAGIDIIISDTPRELSRMYAAERAS